LVTNFVFAALAVQAGMPMIADEEAAATPDAPSD